MAPTTRASSSRLSAAPAVPPPQTPPPRQTPTPRSSPLVRTQARDHTETGPYLAWYQREGRFEDPIHCDPRAQARYMAAFKVAGADLVKKDCPPLLTQEDLMDEQSPAVAFRFGLVPIHEFAEGTVLPKYAKGPACRHAGRQHCKPKFPARFYRLDVPDARPLRCANHQARLRQLNPTTELENIPPPLITAFDVERDMDESLICVLHVCWTCHTASLNRAEAPCGIKDVRLPQVNEVDPAMSEFDYSRLAGHADARQSPDLEHPGMPGPGLEFPDDDPQGFLGFPDLPANDNGSADGSPSPDQSQTQDEEDEEDKEDEEDEEDKEDEEDEEDEEEEAGAGPSLKRHREDDGQPTSQAKRRRGSPVRPVPSSVGSDDEREPSPVLYDDPYQAAKGGERRFDDVSVWSVISRSIHQTVGSRKIIRDALVSIWDQTRESAALSEESRQRVNLYLDKREVRDERYRQLGLDNGRLQEEVGRRGEAMAGIPGLQEEVQRLKMEVEKLKGEVTSVGLENKALVTRIGELSGRDESAQASLIRTYEKRLAEGAQELMKAREEVSSLRETERRYLALKSMPAPPLPSPHAGPSSKAMTGMPMTVQPAPNDQVPPSHAPNVPDPTADVQSDSSNGPDPTATAPLEASTGSSPLADAPSSRPEDSRPASDALEGLAGYESSDDEGPPPDTSRALVTMESSSPMMTAAERSAAERRAEEEQGSDEDKGTDRRRTLTGVSAFWLGRLEGVP